MEKGTLYGVGVGPGDKELITVKAINILKKSDIIALPNAKSGNNKAYDIIKEHIEGKEIIYIDMPMIKDRVELEKSHRAGAEIIQKYLDMGKNVAFATLGDVSIYSTYMYIHRIITSYGYNTIIIPGVTSFSASAARLNMSLCDGDTPLIIIPANYKDNKELLSLNATKVLMKSGSKLEQVKKEIKELGLEKNTFMVENCGMENEKIYYDFSKVEDKTSYFSLIIIKEDNI